MVRFARLIHRRVRTFWPAFGRRRLRRQSQKASSILPSVDELEAQRRRWPVRPILGRMTVA
jgi:hypothetical protein